MHLPALAAIGIVLAALVVAWGRRRGTLLRTVLAAIVVSAAVWAAALVVQARGWQDTDGWVDCYPHCDAWHHAGAVSFWVPLVLAAALLVVAGVVAVQCLTAQR